MELLIGLVFGQPQTLGLRMAKMTLLSLGMAQQHVHFILRTWKLTDTIPGDWADKWMTVGSYHSKDGNRYVYYDGKLVATQSMGSVIAQEWVMLTMALTHL